MKKLLSVFLCVIFCFSFVACNSKSKTKIEQEFDEHDRLVQETILVQGKVHSKTTFQYDVDGNCSREEHYDKNDVLTYYITYEYNSQAQVIKEIQYQDNKMFTETTMEYNDKNLLYRSDTITYQGGKSYWLYFYDENNKLTETKQYAVYSDGDSLRFWDKFDQAGNKISSSYYVTSGALDYTKVWEYDNKNRVKTITEYDSSGNIKSVVEYDKNGNIK